MSLQNQVLIFLAIAAGVAVIAYTTWPRKMTARCPECGKRRNVELSRQPQGTARAFEIPIYHGEGGGSSEYKVQQDIEVKFRCSNCEHHFSQMITQTR